MGNLTITFNKPIILPPIRVDNMTVAEAAGDVTAANTTSRLLLDKETLQFEYDISEVLAIYVESSFYDEDSQEIAIKSYNLTRLTERHMDI